MPINERLLKRFEELSEQGANVPIEWSEEPSFGVVDTEAFQQWASSAMHLVSSVFGEDSPHYRNLAKAYSHDYSFSSGKLAAMRGIFSGAKSDYEGGYLFRLESTVSGEIFGDFVVAAKAALGEGQKDVAAVLACAALEDTLKRFGRSKGLDVDGKVMQEVVNALKAKGQVSGPQKSLLEAMPKIRDAAMHADWGKITSQDVGSVIGYLEQFLLANF